MLSPLMKMVEHGLVCLQSVYMNFPQMSFSVRDVQGCWLKITAVLNYMTIFKPRMDSANVNTLPHPIADTVGVFTTDIHVVQDFFCTGLPCWLIWPASNIVDVNILEVVPLVSPTGALVLKQHCIYSLPMFVGPTSLLHKYDAMLRFAQCFLWYPDQFNNPVDSNDIPFSKDVGSSTMALHSSAHTRTLPGPSNWHSSAWSKTLWHNGWWWPHCAPMLNCTSIVTFALTISWLYCGQSSLSTELEVVFWLYPFLISYHHAKQLIYQHQYS